MITDKAFTILLAHMLPKDINDNFELTDVTDEPFEDCPAVHFHLEERSVKPEGYPEALPNGFHQESAITDFPMRDKVVVLHVKRRRWKDADGRSIPSREHALTAKGTRHSLEFASFLKDVLGLEPDNGGISG